MNISDCTGRLAPWSLRIQQHDFEIRHRPGSQHGNADALSRRSYDLPVPTLSAYDIPGVPTARIRDAQRRDPDLAHILGILLMNSCNTDIFFSNYYHLQSVRFELLVTWKTGLSQRIMVQHAAYSSR